MIRECYKDIIRWIKEDNNSTALCIKGGVMSGKTYLLKELLTLDSFEKTALLECNDTTFIKFKAYYNYHLIKTKSKDKALIATLRELVVGFSNTKKAALIIDDLDCRFSSYFDNALKSLKCRIIYTESTIAFSQKGYVGIFPRTKIILGGVTFKEYINNTTLKETYSKAGYKLCSNENESLLSKAFDYFYARGSLITCYKEDKVDDYKQLYEEYICALEKDILRIKELNCDAFTLRAILIAISKYTGKASCSTTSKGTLVNYCTQQAVADENTVIKVINYLEANRLLVASSNICSDNSSTYSRFYFTNWEIPNYLLGETSGYAGSILESYIASVLSHYKFKLYYYYYTDNTPLELDFVVVTENNKHIALEVKSSFTKGKSITRALDSKIIDNGIYIVKNPNKSPFVGCTAAMLSKYIEEGRLCKLSKTIYDYETDEILNEIINDINVNGILDDITKKDIEC